MYFLVFFYFFVMGFRVDAQDLPPAPFKVVDVVEQLVVLDLPKNKKAISPFVIFVRPSEGSFDIIARGRIEAIQKNKMLVAIDRESILKFPLVGDLAVPAGAPKDWPQDQAPFIQMPEIGAETEDPIEPGYFQVNYGSLSGKMQTTSSDMRTNEYKDLSQLDQSYLHFLWYFDFLWRVGLEYETWSGAIPTSTYYRENALSREKTTTLSLNYRFYRSWFRNRVRPTLRLFNSVSQFATENKDEYLLSSTITGLGLGARLAYERDEALWKPKRGSGFKFLQAYVDVNFAPMATASDNGIIKRGSSGAGSTILDLRLGTSSTLYVNWIPWIKRYTLDFGYVQRTASIKFSGPSVSEVGGVYRIPSDLTSTETSDFYFVTVGVRFEDLVGRFLKPR